jgi:uncharacterized protein
LGAAVMHGHQIVYAPRTIEVPAAMVWPHWVKDRPSPGARIAEGQPLCNLFAEGAGADDVETLLDQYQDEILQMLSLPACQPVQRKVAM